MGPDVPRIGTERSARGKGHTPESPGRPHLDPAGLCTRAGPACCLEPPSHSPLSQQPQEASTGGHTRPPSQILHGPADGMETVHPVAGKTSVTTDSVAGVYPPRAWTAWGSPGHRTRLSQQNQQLFSDPGRKAIPGPAAAQHCKRGRWTQRATLPGSRGRGESVSQGPSTGKLLENEQLHFGGRTSRSSCWKPRPSRDQAPRTPPHEWTVITRGCESLRPWVHVKSKFSSFLTCTFHHGMRQPGGPHQRPAPEASDTLLHLLASTTTSKANLCPLLTT